MNIWPWSRFDKLQRELAIKQGQLDACGLAAASGRFGFTDANMFSPSLVEVMGLIQNRDWYIVQYAQALEQVDKLEGELERARAGLPPRL